MKRGHSTEEGSLAVKGQAVDCRKTTPGADKRPSPNAEYPVVHLDAAVLVRETQLVQTVLAQCGVRPRDLSDVTQHVFIAAWRAICDGGFRPRPDRDLHHALRRWLAGIARRQASVYRRTSRYGSIVSELPVEEHDIAIESTTENQVDARSHLELFERVPRKHREVLVLIALGGEPIEAARELGISREASLARIRYGRAWFERVITRWRRGRGSQ
jgi:DNA-directed RNA polymerase specialized sigma24 family protein